MRVRWSCLLLPGLAVTVALAVLPAAGASAEPTSASTRTVSVAAQHPPRIVSGYVQSGGPLAGAVVRIYLPGRKQPIVTTRTSPYGYFLARLPKLPGRLRVEATGGRGPIGTFTGTMIGIAPNPTTHDSFYANPTTTMVATYLDQHPESNRAMAMAKMRSVLGLKRYHTLDGALGGRPSYFDGVKFLRTAERNGGFDAYIASLVAQMDSKRGSVSFRRATTSADLASPARVPSSAIAGLIGEEAAGYLGIASQATGIVSATVGLMSFVGGLVGWSPDGATTGQVLSAIDQVQSTLTIIGGDINDLKSDLATDFTTLKLPTDQQAFNTAVAPVYTAYNDVSNAQADYADLVNDQWQIACVPPQPPVTPPACPTDKTDAQSAAAAKLSAYTKDIGTLENDLGTSKDVFHDAVLSNGGTTPALTFLVDLYLDRTDQIFLPAGTNVVKDFTAKALMNQAMAYYLILAYEESLDSGTPTPGGKIDLISTSYLGPDYASWPQYTSAAQPPTTPTTPPAAGNLHDEMGYLQSVMPVPAGMAVDGNQGGLMYVTSGTVDMAAYLPVAAASRTSCGSVDFYDTGYRDYSYDVPGGGWDVMVCTELADALSNFIGYVEDFADAQGPDLLDSVEEASLPGTFWSGLDTGWNIITQGTLAAMLERLPGNGVPYYYDPGPLTFGGTNSYTVDEDTLDVCADTTYGTGACPGVTLTYDAVDSVEHYFTDSADGSAGTCTWGVGQANNATDECASTMPALLGRPLDPGEVYIPRM